MTKKYFALCGIASLSVVACTSTPSSTGTFILAASARLAGTVESTTGQPLDSARVSLVLPGEYGIAYAFTNARGEFSVNANRLGQLSEPPKPDTLRVDVFVQWIKGKRADGTYPELRTKQLLTFAPSSPIPSVVTLTVPLP